MFGMDAPNPYAGLGGPVADLPEVLSWEDSSGMLSAVRPPEVLFGVDDTGEAVTADLDSESPHILVSGGTGAGKSAIARSLAVQRLARGDQVVFLDVKLHSHRWAKRLQPNVHYASALPDIGGALVNLGRELHRRNDIIDRHDGPVETAPVGPRIIVVFEEVNSTLGQLVKLDRSLPRGHYMALDGFRDIMFMGRAAGIHLIAFAQLASFRAMGGAEIVENFAHRILVRHSVQSWKWLAADCGRFRPSPTVAGRGFVCQGGKARETQLTFIPERQATETVLGSVPARKLARKLSGSLQATPVQWRTALTR